MAKDEWKKWLFYATDENGDSQSLKDFYFIGTYQEACNYALQCADEWEKQLGEITKLVIESHGRV